MRRVAAFTFALSLFGTAVVEAAPPVSLRGSNAAMVQQNTVAKEHGLTFYRTAADIRGAVAAGDLVELTGNENYEVASFVRHPYLQPEGKLFIERIAAQYRETCGQKLVVTSAVRPTTGQPSNSHRLSVHPAGMAIDLRVSDRASCRDWLETALLNLERQGVLNGIREFNPPHYHVAVFPAPYMAYVEERLAIETAQKEEEEAHAVAAAEVELPAVAGVTNFVARADERSDSAPAPRRAALAGLLALGILVVPFGFWRLGEHIRRM